MSLKGGYKILDLSLNPTYNEIAEILDTEKAVLVSGLVVEGVKQKDCFAQIEGDYLHVYVYTYNNSEFIDDIVIKIEFTEPVFKNTTTFVNYYPVFKIRNGEVSQTYINDISTDKKSMELAIEGFANSLYLDIRIKIK